MARSVPGVWHGVSIPALQLQPESPQRSGSVSGACGGWHGGAGASLCCGAAAPAAVPQQSEAGIAPASSTARSQDEMA